jgi:transcriptional regulator GlxA family with amidase domain
MAVAFLLIPGFALMSYAAAVEPLRAANVLSGRELYRWIHVAPQPGPVAASNGVAIVPDHSIHDAFEADLILVCAAGNPATFHDRATLAWLRKVGRRDTPVGGVSGGAYLLALAGLLDGYRCTIHWEHGPAFQERFPDLDVTASLFEIDRNRLTCSGGIASLDMMHALITRHHGFSLAAKVSDWFLHTQIRHSADAQRMELRRRLGVGDRRLLATIQLMESHIEDPLQRDQLARLAGLSPRQLERLFERHLGCTLRGHYVALRLERARSLLLETALPLTQVAMATGFASLSHFSRSYKAAHGRPPSIERAAR